MDQSQAFHRLESRLQVGFEVEGIMMMACDNARSRHDIALGVSDGQDIGCVGTFSGLVSHCCAAFLGKGMTAVQIQFRKIQVVLDSHNALFPHLF